VLGNKAQAVGGVGEDADALISPWCPGRPRLRRRLGSGRTAGAWASRRGRRRLSRSTRGWPRLPRGRRRVAARQRSRDDIPLAELPCAVRLAGSAAFVPQGTHAVLEDAEACGSVPVAAGCRFVSLAGLWLWVRQNEDTRDCHGKRIRRPMAEARAGAELAGLQQFPGAVASSVTSSSAVGFGPSLPRVQYQRSLGAPASRGRESAVIPSRMRSGPRGWCPGVPHAVIDAESTIR
jgi:hypothetical protein